ncbi:SDR family NAD(P)-dependent oxidoreductase [Sporichthya polymorpha]|uniref:SDR family NAD(P)-dependent oxidoreductase n=1 Tax=Sporichthya polymorpha TaxID=35751 RepID=UPI00036BCBC6|nr:SDR family oxidoreductase [Sporichthya polymorpha]
MRFAPGRTAIITGAGVGIGKAIAARFADEGLRLVLADIEGDLVEKVAAELAGPGRPAPLVVVGDLSVRQNAATLIGTCQEAYGQVDILVNNAGGGVIRPTLSHTEETLRATLDRNLWTTLYCSLEALPLMKAAGYGRIINMGADSVRNGLDWHAIYNAAKGGVHGLTTGWAREFVTDGITVNAIAPSATRTEAYDAFEQSTDPAIQATLAKVLAVIPAGRAGTVEEIAALAAYLASDESGFTTGQVLSINGGSTML